MRKERISEHAHNLREPLPGAALLPFAPLIRDLEMRLLLDTHALLWWLADAELSDSARDAIAEPDNEVIVSASNAWEISIKKSLGKLSAPDDLEEQIEINGFTPLSISMVHARTAGALPRHHDDPFDRMLIAQALLEGLTIVTRDKRFAAYGVAILNA